MHLSGNLAMLLRIVIIVSVLIYSLENERIFYIFFPMALSLKFSLVESHELKIKSEEFKLLDVLVL